MKEKLKDILVTIKRNPKDFIIILLLSINLLLTFIFIFRTRSEFLDLKRNIWILKEDLEDIEIYVRCIERNLQ